MKKIIKNRKFLFASFFFIFLFLFLFTFLAKAQPQVCVENCEKCNNQATCELASCIWEGVTTPEAPPCCDKLQTNWPRSPMGTSLSGCGTLPVMIKYIYEWGIVLGGLAAFIALLMAGFQYLTSVGDPSKMKEAQSQIISAILGLILLLGSWLVLNTINPALTTFHNVIFDPEEMPEVGGFFSLGESEACGFALLYENTDYGGTSAIIPSRECDLLGNCWSEYRTDNDYKSVKSFIACQPCDSCTPEEVEMELELPEAERKCVDLDGDGFYFNEETCENPGDGNYYAIQDECEQVIIDKLGQDECLSVDCNAYWKEGGSCTVQLFGDPDWTVFWETCGDKISEVYARHPDFSRITDRKIDCIKLIKHVPGQY